MSKRLAALVLLLVGTTQVVAQNPPSMVLQGQAVTAVELNGYLEAAEGGIQALDKEPGDDPARKARRAALERERDLLKRAITRLGWMGEKGSEQIRLETEIAKANTALTALQVESQREVSYETMTQERLDALVAESETAKQESTRQSAVLEAAAAAMTSRTKGFDGVAAEIGKVEAAFKAAREALAGAPEGPARAAANRVARSAELELRWLESERDHHKDLLNRDKQVHELARLRSEAAAAQLRWNANKVQAARTAREATLKKEAEEKGREARRKKELAEALSDTPAWSAVTALEGLVASFEAAEKEEQGAVSWFSGQVERCGFALEEVERRNESIRKLFPRGVDLDQWRVQALAKEQTRLEGLARLRETRLDPVLRGAETKRHEILSARDRLASLEDTIAQSEREAIRDLLSPSGLDEAQDTFIKACRDFSAADPTIQKELGPRYVESKNRLKELIVLRLAGLNETEGHAEKLDELEGSIDRAMRWRSRYLEDLSFWLRFPAPLSAAEGAALLTELEAIGGELTRIPDHARQTWTWWERHAYGARTILVAALAWISLSLVGGFYAGRSLRNTRLLKCAADELDPLAAALRIMAALAAAAPRRLLLLLGFCWLSLGLFPEDPVSRILLAASFSAWGLPFVRTLAGLFFDREDSQRGLVACEAQTAKSANSAVRALLGAIVLLLPAILVLDQMEVTRLSRLLMVLLEVWCLGIAAWLVVRRDVLRAFAPKTGGAVIRSFRALLPFVWPVVVAFYAVVVAFHALGYRRVAYHYGTRLLACACALLIGAVIFQLLVAMIQRKFQPRDESGEAWTGVRSLDRPTAGTLGFRLVRGLIFLVMAAATLVAISAMLEIEFVDWTDFLDIVLLNMDRPLRVGDVCKSLAVLLIGLAIAAFIRDLLRVILVERMQQGSRYVIRTLAYYTLVATTIMVALSALGLEFDQLGWFLTAAGVGIGFGLQDVISNFIAGLILFFERPVQVGDIVTVGTIEGDVTRINIRSTEVRTRDGISIIIPNKRFITDDVVNWSHGDKRTRLRIAVGVAYGSDVPLVKKVLLEAANDDGRVLKRPPPEVGFLEFGDSQLSFELMVWLPRPDVTLRRLVTSDLNSAIDAAFHEHGIEIPFPQRDLHLRSTPETRAALAGGAAAEDDSAPDEDQPARKEDS